MMKDTFQTLLILTFLAVSIRKLPAGGSGLNVLVVVNRNSTNSVELGNYYAERRQVPPQNYLRINWAGGNTGWTDTDFNTYLYTPLLALLSSQQLTNQIDYVVLSMDIPHWVSSGSSKLNSTTSMLFYGFKTDTNSLGVCSMAAGSTNFYAGSEGIFRATPPINATSNSFLVTMITHSNLALAKQIVDSGAFADATFPTQTVYLAKSSDVARNVRYLTSDNAVFNARLRKNYSLQRINTTDNSSFINSLGAQQGTCCLHVFGSSFVPGSMADNLTSYGGLLFQFTGGQLSCLEYLTAGAAGTYGTVTEPCNYLEKFPSPQNYFYQARGFSLAECYYQSLTNPYQGIIVGEPLAAPFALPASATWVGLPTNTLLSGTTNLSLQITAADTNHPVQQADLFWDGVWLQTLTNIPPARSNLLNATINGQSINYLVPLNATLKSVTTGLTAAINDAAILTSVNAFAHGDRIELQSSDRSKTGGQVSLTVSNSIGSSSAATTWIAASNPGFLDTIASGLRNFQITGNPAPGSFLFATITKTNGSQFTFGVTNISVGNTLSNMVQTLLDSINSTPGLAGADGLVAQDLLTDADSTQPIQQSEFNLQANTLGWDAAQIQASLIGSFVISPMGTVHLDDNLPDLEPRNHIYLTAGVTNLSLTFPFNTTALANGYHQLTAVVYEGSHVRTQKRLDQTVFVQNGALSATFYVPAAASVGVESMLQFGVAANTGSISRIELFSTGGSLGFVTGQSSNLFSIAASTLGLGLHPFYAIVTSTTGQQYRTETRSIRIVGAETPFLLSITVPPPFLTWPATPGRSYDILSASNLGDLFQILTTIVPTNGLGQWTDTNSAGFRRFYQVRTSN